MKRKKEELKYEDDDFSDDAENNNDNEMEIEDNIDFTKKIDKKKLKEEKM